MESTELNEMESLLLNVERPIFTNQEKFDNNFLKNRPSEKKKRYVKSHHRFTSLSEFYLLINNNWHRNVWQT
jgi:hypothetical protein